jgi:hypothetical protein
MLLRCVLSFDASIIFDPGQLDNQCPSTLYGQHGESTHLMYFWIYVIMRGEVSAAAGDWKLKCYAYPAGAPSPSTPLIASNHASIISQNTFAVD